MANLRQINCLFAIALLISAAAARAGGLAPPPGVNLPIVSPNEGYIIWFDQSPLIPGTPIFNPHYYPVVKAVQDLASYDRTGPWSIGNPQGYDHGYELLGFEEPNFDGGPRVTYYWACGESCDNGLAQADQIVMPANVYRGRSEACTRSVLGHELKHKIQRTYRVSTAPDNPGKWVTEGQARAMQDKIYDDLDLDTAGDCTAPYIGQVNGYLRDDHVRSLWDLSYDAALWWTYLMEQYGEVTDEPWYGADFLVAWWDQALLAGENGDSFDITDDTIKYFDGSQNITSTYRDFVLANIIKDMRLQNLSDAFIRRYSYVDESAAGQDAYAQVEFFDELTISNGDSTDTATFIADNYAVNYFKVDISGCSSGRPIQIGFEPSPTDPFFGNPINQTGAWGVVVGQSNVDSQSQSTQRPAKLYKKIDEDWTVNLFQPYVDPYESVYVATSGIGGPVIGTLRARCLPVPANPWVPDVPLVNPLDPVTPGPPDTFTFGEVCAQPSAPLPGLDPDDYTVEVGSEPAKILAATPNEDGHCLLVEFPEQPVPGAYDLTIELAGESVTVDDAIVHNDPAPNVLIAVDTSTTMSSPAVRPVLDDVQVQLAALVDQLVLAAVGPNPRIGLLDVAGDDVEPNQDAPVVAPLLPADPDHVSRLKLAIGALESGPSRFSAIGDALLNALNEFNQRGDSQQARHLILVSDGPENDAPFWSGVELDVLLSGMNVHTIAIGPLADQPLLYEIATKTGGSYRYVPVGEKGVDFVALANALSDVALGLNGALTVHREVVPMQPMSGHKFDLVVLPATAALLLPAVQKVPSTAGRVREIGTLTLTDPEGTVYPPIPLNNRALFTYQLDIIEPIVPGAWEARVETNEHSSGEWVLEAAVQRDVPLILETGIARPEADDTEGGGFVVGESVRLSAGAFDACTSTRTCTAGKFGPGGVQILFADGSVRLLDLDRPERLGRALEDMAKGVPVDSFSFNYSKIQPASQGSPSGLPDDGVSGNVGSYTLQYEIDVDYGDYLAKAIRRDGYAVRDAELRTNRGADSDRDGLPNRYEEAKYCLDPSVRDATQDQDDDGLSSLEEFLGGTDACNPDTDGGGETDGSEVAAGREPLARRDDAIGGVEYLRFAHDVTHDAPGKFAPNTLTLQFGMPKGANDLTMKRGRVGGDRPGVVATLSGVGDSIWVDTGLTPGAEYCYQLTPNGPGGIVGAPSDWMCATANSDPTRPWGHIDINDGRPRTDDPKIRLKLSVYNKATSRTEMRIRTGGVDTGWIPHTPEWTNPNDSDPGIVEASVQFRDEFGTLSEVYKDTIIMHPPNSLGSLTGRALLDRIGPSPMIMVSLQSESTEPPAYTNENGEFRLENLEPGTYTLVSQQMGWDPATAANFTVSSGQTTDIGDMELPIGSELLFEDGFGDEGE